MFRRNADELKEIAHHVRLDAIEMAHLAGNHGAHLGGSMSSAEIYTVLYGAVLNIRPDDPAWEGRDRLVAGKEHSRLSEYPAMAEAGLFDKGMLPSYMENGGLLAGHLRNTSIGLEYSSCSLGMALPVAVGMALAAKKRGQTHKVYTVMGDGELNEGSMWEAFMAAAHFSLDNLIAVVDRNGLSSDGPTEEIMALGDLNAKLNAFGWDCVTVDGHDIDALLGAFAQAGKQTRPFAVIAKTVKGSGVSYAENDHNWHHNVMTDELYEKAIKEEEERWIGC